MKILKYVILVAILLLLSCSEHKVYNYADYKRSFDNGMQFYSQYEIAYQKEGKVFFDPFLSDRNNYLPEKVIELHYGLKIVNPYKVPFDVWMTYEVKNVDGNEVLKRKEHVYKSQLLPLEFIIIELPHETNIHSNIKCKISVIDNRGETLYESFEAFYKVRGSKKIN